MNPLHDELLALERQLLDPATRRDSRSLEALLAEEFLEHGASGRTWTRAETLAALATEQPRTFELEAFEVRELAPTVALARYVLSSDGRRSLRASVWVRRSERWQLVAGFVSDARMQCAPPRLEFCRDRHASMSATTCDTNARVGAARANVKYRFDVVARRACTLLFRRA